MEEMNNNYLKLIPCNDIIGVEVGGSFKNVYTIAIGMCDGLGYGLNTKAALLTLAIKEMADLIQAMGGKRKTAYGLAGIGDLIGTSLCDDSRNRTFGEYLGKNIPKEQAIKKVKQVVEGIEATKCLIKLSKKYCLTSGRTPATRFNFIFLAFICEANFSKIITPISF